MSKLSPVLKKMVLSERAKKKILQGRYIVQHAMLGYKGIVHYYLVGHRGRGKSVIAWESVYSFKKNYGWDNVRVYYFRNSQIALNNVLANNCMQLLPDVTREWHQTELSRKVNVVYDHNKMLCTCYPLVSAAKLGKGISDNCETWIKTAPINPKTGKRIKRFVIFILEEFLNDETQEIQGHGNPFIQYQTYLGTLIRLVNNKELGYDAIKCFYLANDVSEKGTAEWIGQHLNYIPKKGEYGIVKLTRQNALIWTIPDTEEYKKAVDESIVGKMAAEDDSNYSNVINQDYSLIKPKRIKLHKITRLIKFSKQRNQWFCLWDGIYIKMYNNEDINKSLVIPMSGHIDKFYDKELANDIVARYFEGYYRYNDIRSMCSFIASMKSKKPSK